MKSEVDGIDMSPTTFAAGNTSDAVHTKDLGASGATPTTIPSNPSPHKNRLFHIFIVDYNISYLNFISYLIACFATICLVAYLGIIQPFVLTMILNIQENKGNITGSLALYDEIIAIPATLFWGVFSDRIGRRPIYSVGFICLGTALILYPYVKNVYPHMLLCRLLFSLGSSACTCMMTGTLGDIAGSQHERGRVSAIVGLFSGLGGLVAGLVLVKLPWQLGELAKDEVQGLRLSFTIVGGCSLALALIFFVTMPTVGRGAADGLTRWIKNHLSRKKSAEDSKDSADEETIHPLRMLAYGFLAGRDPRVALAYVSSFVSRADTVLFTSFISLWVIQHFIEEGLCNPENRTSCEAASRGTHTLTGIGQGISLISAPIFGYASERFKKSTVLAVAGFLGAIGSLPFAFTTKPPTDKSNFVFVSFLGAGQIGMIITGMTLVNGLHVDTKYRGSVAGVFSFSGAISIMAMARLGGYLFDVWIYGAPFVLMGIAHLVVAVLSIYVRIVTPRLEREDQARFQAKQENVMRLESDQVKTS
ncbi:hypothetical protein BX616_005474 [Lobosporangium transversale]|uniref:Major facilitator superfamily domain-containing protein n=1 Tax=Lobosporangium transversale TaxID=64571 RepID=A0A1Y2G6T4_9FUNG|nr:major facilitator superfamily domain-containing protein [Lobosporangium transversale]KAF9915748.1 hypothetical protein BX616_005474 [Lobosporangium transversale]ORY98387.1 major facilitator superfamily domain-containing protein [Lobosporangium transversale]|eukprot:XP_021875779.1 major facilitator superfamily domain-containing protein [Lobosporangium transversale]